MAHTLLGVLYWFRQNEVVLFYNYCIQENLLCQYSNKHYFSLVLFLNDKLPFSAEFSGIIV